MSDWTPPKKPVILSGGNPQVPKGDGDAPVQYFIDHMPEWQQPIGRRLDALIMKAVPGAQKAVRWNSPFYEAGQGYFLSFHCFTKYVKVAFLKGLGLDPLPPVASKDLDARYLHVGEGESIDEDQFVAWLKQAAARPGWTP